MTQVLRIMMYELRIMVFVLTMILASLFIIHPAYAQESTPSSAINTQFTNLPTTVSPTSPIYTDLIVSNMFHTFSCLAVGQSVIGQQCLTYQMQKNAQGVISGVPMLSSVNTSGGILGTTGNLIGALYLNPPVRTADYLASIGQDLGIVKEANAQVVGSGGSILNPILMLWQVGRNISYVIMIIIFVIIGLMVMFRTKINPQTVITAQAALPGLVVGLIMITFSYFLASLISDTAFIGTNLVGYYFSIAQRPNEVPQNLVKDATNRNVLSIFTPFTRIMGQGDISKALNSIWDDLADPTIKDGDLISLDPQRVLRYLSTMIFSQFALPFGGMFGGPGQIVAGLISVTSVNAFPVDIAAFALSFAAIAILIYSMFRLLLRLINSYLTIIFLTATAPFQFLDASLPGRQSIATDWILNMLANVLAFPAVLAVFYFVAFLLGPSFVSNYCDNPRTGQACLFQIRISQDNGLVTPAYAQSVVDKPTFPLLGGLDLKFINLLLAFGALIALPAIPDIIARTIGKVSQAGQLLGQEISGSTAAGQRYAGQFQQGIGSIPGQVGKITDTKAWQPEVSFDSQGKQHITWVPNKLQSQAGLKTRVRNFFKGY